MKKKDLGHRIIFPNDSFTQRCNTTIPKHSAFPDSQSSQPLVIFACAYRPTEGDEIFHTVVFRQMVRVNKEGNVAPQMISRSDLTHGGDSVGLMQSYLISDKVK